MNIAHQWFGVLVTVLIMLIPKIGIAAEPLTEKRIEEFGKLLWQLTKESPRRIYPYLSDDLEVELNVGSSAQGVTLHYNKADYIRVVEKSLFESKIKWEDFQVDMFDFIVHSPTRGQYTARSYFEGINTLVWGTYFVEVRENNMYITKIVESL